MKTATVAVFDNSIQANIAKTRLESEGLRAFLSNEALVSAVWSLNQAVGGIRLDVAEKDQEQALRILEQPSHVLDSETEMALEPVLTQRDKNADRAFYGAIFGIIFWPLFLYVPTLLIQISLSNEVLLPEKRRRAWIATAINSVAIIAFFSVWYLFRR